MSAKAKARTAAGEAARRAQEEADWQADTRRIAEEQRPEFEAGPPNGCRECYVWVRDWLSPRHIWFHGSQSAKPGPPPPREPDAPPWLADDADEANWCWHECHGDEAPRYCGLIAMACSG